MTLRALDFRARSTSLVALGLAMTVGMAFMAVGATSANAAQPTIGLGTAGSFAVLAGTTVTNTGPSLISGDIGVNPGTAVTGFPPGVEVNGVVHAADAVALGAESDTTTAYNQAAGAASTGLITADLGGQSLSPGVYTGGALQLTGVLTLNAHGDAGAVFIFKASSTLTTASNSVVSLINGADACNVFWQIGSSATIGTGTSFVGTILALTSIHAQTNAVIAGRLLARNAAVTLDDNVITAPVCSATGSTTTGSTTAPATSVVASTTPTTAPASSGTTVAPAGGTTATTIAPAGGTTGTTITPAGGTTGTTITPAGGTTGTSITPAGVIAGASVTPTGGTTSTTVTPAGGLGGGGATLGSLPFTGTNPTAPIIFGVLSILAGLFTITMARRRSATPPR